MTAPPARVKPIPRAGDAARAGFRDCVRETPFWQTARRARGVAPILPIDRAG